MKISKNYQLNEFAVSATAAARGIKLEVPDWAVCNVKTLVEKLLQPINDATGWRNQVTSGYRSPEVNKLVGGVPSSQHLTGMASDNKFYEVDGAGKFKRWVTPIEVLRAVKGLGIEFDQMIAYPSFVHLSYNPARPNRRQVLYNKSYTGKRL